MRERSRVGDSFGVTATASPLQRIQDPLQQSELCSHVSYANGSSASVSYFDVEWKLQTPSGQVEDRPGLSSTLNSGELVKGGTTSGQLCFSDPGATGQYVLIWKPNPFQSDRAVWLMNVG